MQHDATHVVKHLQHIVNHAGLTKFTYKEWQYYWLTKFMNQNHDVKWLRFTKSISHKTVQLQYAWGQERVNMALRE